MPEVLPLPPLPSLPAIKAAQPLQQQQQLSSSCHHTDGSAHAAPLWKPQTLNIGNNRLSGALPEKGALPLGLTTFAAPDAGLSGNLSTWKAPRYLEALDLSYNSNVTWGGGDLASLPDTLLYLDLEVRLGWEGVGQWL